MAMLSKPAIGGIHYWCESDFGSNVLSMSLTIDACTAWKTQGDWFNTWSFLSSSGGPDGLARIGDPENRPLLIPANGQSNFWPTSQDMSGKAHQRKRSHFPAEETSDAVEIWDKGCRAAQEFADYGAR